VTQSKFREQMKIAVKSPLKSIRHFNQLTSKLTTAT